MRAVRTTVYTAFSIISFIALALVMAASWVLALFPDSDAPIYLFLSGVTVFQVGICMMVWVWRPKAPS